MSARRRCLVLLSDGLELPPRLGYQVHLLSLARAASAQVPTRVFAWTKGVPVGLPAHVHALPEEGAPAGRLARKREYLRQALRWVEAHAAPGSVLWVRSYSTALLLVPFLRSKKRKDLGLVSVYDAASFLRLEAGQVGHPLADRARGFVEERLWGLFDRVRTLSDPMAEYLIQRGVPAGKIVVLPVGSHPPAERWRPPEKPSRLLYVGSGVAWQGLPNLLEAMRRLGESGSPARLTVVGAEENGGPREPLDNVEFRARVPHDRIAEVYLEHHLFVIPRPRTPLTELVVPMKVPEAMSFGIPILGTDLEAVRWVVGEGGAWLVPDNDPASLVRGIEGALSHPARLVATGEKARERSRRFAWDALGRELVEKFF